MALRKEMDKLVKATEQKIFKNHNIEHQDLFMEIAEEFNLFDKDNIAPLWLSNVIKSIMDDVLFGIDQDTAYCQ